MTPQDVFLCVQGGIQGCGVHACASTPYVQQVPLGSEPSKPVVKLWHKHKLQDSIPDEMPPNTFNWKDYL